MNIEIDMLHLEAPKFKSGQTVWWVESDDDDDEIKSIHRGTVRSAVIQASFYTHETDIRTYYWVRSTRGIIAKDESELIGQWSTVELILGVHAP